METAHKNSENLKIRLQDTLYLSICADSRTTSKNQKKITLLTKDQTHCGTLYSLWTCPTTEHPTHRRHAPPQTTLLTVDLPHCGPAPPWNTLLNMDLPHIRKPYSLWPFPTAEHPTHHGPAPPRPTYSPLTCPTAEHPTHSGPA